MRITAIMPCRNSGWVLGLSLRALLMWVDDAIVLNHCSTDDTQAILDAICREHPGRLKIIKEDNPTWEEMRHRQALLDLARMPLQPGNQRKGISNGSATHIVTIDDDEVLTGNLLPAIRDTVERAPKGATIQFPWLALRDSINAVHKSGLWGEQDVSIGFREDEKANWQARDGYDFHHRHPCGRPFIPWSPVKRPHGGLMHLQFVDGRRLRAKQAWYQIQEVLRWPNREPREAVRERYSIAIYGSQNIRPHERAQALRNLPLQLGHVPASWWEPYAALMPHLKVDAEPWQERMVRDAIAEHGRERFAGLDLFGL